MADPVKVADMIARRASELIDPLRDEMELKKWPADFKAIMWRAVALTANRLASEAEAQR